MHIKRKYFKTIIILIIIYLSIYFLKNSHYEENRRVETTLNKYIYKDGFTSEELSSDIKIKITGYSYPLEFDKKYTKISYDDLRYLNILYKDFSNISHTGEMIVNKHVAKEVLKIFYELYKSDYPIAKIDLVDSYNASDELSMENNNTSCFNYRMVENSNKLSWHSFGLAIDINPLYNPYVIKDEVYPTIAYEYVNRINDFKGKISHDDLAYKVFTKYGWKWGGDFIHTKDYQHFYKDTIYDDTIRLIKE